MIGKVLLGFVALLVALFGWFVYMTTPTELLNITTTEWRPFETPAPEQGHEQEMYRMTIGTYQRRDGGETERCEFELLLRIPAGSTVLNIQDGYNGRQWWTVIYTSNSVSTQYTVKDEQSICGEGSASRFYVVPEDKLLP